jgi:hypothetical protein
MQTPEQRIPGLISAALEAGADIEEIRTILGYKADQYIGPNSQVTQGGGAPISEGLGGLGFQPGPAANQGANGLIPDIPNKDTGMRPIGATDREKQAQSDGKRYDIAQGMFRDMARPGNYKEGRNNNDVSNRSIGIAGLLALDKATNKPGSKRQSSPVANYGYIQSLLGG